MDTLAKQSSQLENSMTMPQINTFTQIALAHKYTYSHYACTDLSPAVAGPHNIVAAPAPVQVQPMEVALVSHDVVPRQCETTTRDK